jgi:hypothetical protein
LDLAQAYLGFKLTDESKPKTAFYGADARLFQFKRMCFGLKSAPVLLAQHIHMILKDVLDITIQFFDDILVISDTWADHLEHVFQTLNRICGAGYKIRVEKCNWGLRADQDELSWLGCSIIRNQLRADPKKVEAILKMERPSTITEVQRYIGCANFLRRFVVNFSEKAKGLYDLIKRKPKPGKKTLTKHERNEALEWTSAAERSFMQINKSIAKATQLMLPVRDATYIVTSDASDTSVACCLSQISGEGKNGIVVNPSQCDFVVKLRRDDFDASKIPTVADLEPGTEYPLAFAIKSFNSREAISYSIPEKELHGLIYALTTFWYFIAGAKIIVRCDCSALTFVRKHKDCCTTIFKLHQLLDGLGDFTVVHVSAVNNSQSCNMMAVADMLSRKDPDAAVKNKISYKELRDPRLNQLKYPEHLPKVTTWKKLCKDVEPYLEEFDRVVMKGVDSKGRPLPQDPVISKLAKKKRWQESVEGRNASAFTQMCQYISDSLDYIEGLAGPRDSTIAGRKVSFCSQVKVRKYDTEYIRAILENDISPESQVLLVTLHRSELSPDELREMQLDDPKLEPIIRSLENGVAVPNYRMKQKALLRMVREPKTNRIIPTVAVPQVLIQELLRFSHARIPGAHVGSERQYKYLRRLWTWDGMMADIERYCMECSTCAYNTYHISPRVNTQEMPVSNRMGDLVYVDLVTSLPKSVDGMTNILTIYDDWSKYGIAVPLKNRTSEEVARAFSYHYIAHFGVPYRIHSDCGEAEAAIFVNMCTILGIAKTHTPIYNPRSNKDEAWNKTIMNMLRHEMASVPGQYWSVFLPYIQLAWNQSVHSSTSRSPQEMVYGRVKAPLSMPVVSWDHEMVRQDEYLANIRAAQEMAWEAMRIRREELAAKKKAAMIGRKEVDTHKFTVGTFVLVKEHSGRARNENKLRPRYRGVYRVIRAMKNSVAIIPWVGSLQNEVKDPNNNQEDDGYETNLDLELDDKTRKKVVRIRHNVVPITDVKLYKGELPIVPEINILRAKVLLETLGVDVSPMRQSGMDLSLPAAVDPGAAAQPLDDDDDCEGIEPKLKKVGFEDSAPNSIITAQPGAEPHVQLPRARGRPRKVKPAEPVPTIVRNGAPVANAVSNVSLPNDVPTNGPSPAVAGVEVPLGRTRSMTRLAASRLEQEVNDAAARENAELNLGQAQEEARGKNGRAKCGIRAAGDALLAEGAGRECSAEGDRAREAIREATARTHGSTGSSGGSDIKSAENGNEAAEAATLPVEEEASAELTTTA